MADTSEILRKYQTIAVVGISNNPMRPSYGVSEYMKRQGYRIIPVNPGHRRFSGEKSIARSKIFPSRSRYVNIFRRSEMIPPVVDSAIAIGAKVLWMQEGIENKDAAEKARAAGLEVVMNTCILKAHQRAEVVRPHSTRVPSTSSRADRLIVSTHGVPDSASGVSSIYAHRLCACEVGVGSSRHRAVALHAKPTVLPVPAKY